MHYMGYFVKVTNCVVIVKPLLFCFMVQVYFCECYLFPCHIAISLPIMHMLRRRSIL
jgi:hypothetical protein